MITLTTDEDRWTSLYDTVCRVFNGPLAVGACASLNVNDPDMFDFVIPAAGAYGTRVITLPMQYDPETPHDVLLDLLLALRIPPPLREDITDEHRQNAKQIVEMLKRPINRGIRS